MAVNTNNHSIQAVQHLLHQFELVTKKHHEIDKLTGSNFNVFNILNLRTKEVRTHSAFINYLLDAQGSHLQGAVFLNLFVAELKEHFEQSHTFLRKFNSANCTSQVEYYAGVVTDEQGGFIDILITDQQKNKIIIENKINAGDGNRQLLRYKAHDPNALLLYLTLHGKTASEASTGSELKAGEHYLRISYKHHIVSWLYNCKQAMIDKPIIRETIEQYIQLIKQLTGQHKSNKMDNELKELLLDGKNLEIARNVAASVDSLQNEINTMVWKTVERKFEELYPKGNNRDVLLFVYNGFNIHYRFSIDNQHYWEHIIRAEKNGAWGNSNHEDIVALKSIFAKGKFKERQIENNNHALAYIRTVYDNYITDLNEYTGFYFADKREEHVALLFEEGKEFIAEMKKRVKEFEPSITFVN